MKASATTFIEKGNGTFQPLQGPLLLELIFPAGSKPDAGVLLLLAAVANDNILAVVVDLVVP